MKKTNTKVVGRMKRMLKHNPCVSLKKGSAKMNIPNNYISQNNYQAFTIENIQKTESPKISTCDQSKRAKKGCALIYRNLCVPNGTNCFDY